MYASLSQLPCVSVLCSCLPHSVINCEITHSWSYPLPINYQTICWERWPLVRRYVITNLQLNSQVDTVTNASCYQLYAAPPHHLHIHHLYIYRSPHHCTSTSAGHHITSMSAGHHITALPHPSPPHVHLQVTTSLHLHIHHIHIYRSPHHCIHHLHIYRSPHHCTSTSIASTSIGHHITSMSADHHTMTQTVKSSS